MNRHLVALTGTENNFEMSYWQLHSLFTFCSSVSYNDTLYHQKLALTSLTSGGHSVSIVQSRTQARELVSRQ
jgi:hypothetical protein